MKPVHVEDDDSEEKRLDIQDYRKNLELIKSSERSLDFTYNEAYKEDKTRLNAEIHTIEIEKNRLIDFTKNMPDEHRPEIHSIVSAEIDELTNLLDRYRTDRDHIELWEKRWEQYPEATEVWLIMKEWGWNDAVCAGVIGNMMAEVGGQTLNLQACIYGGGGWYYGLCMWRIAYYPEIPGLDIPGQMNVLYNSMEEQFGYAGFCYRSGFTLEDFLEMTDPWEAGVAFALVYERPASKHVGHRGNNALVAYNYFVGEGD